MEILRVFGKSSTVLVAVRVVIPKSESPRALSARPLILDQIEIDIQPAGAKNRHASSQLFPRTVACLHSSFLIFRPDIVIVVDIVADGTGPAGSLVNRRQPNGREAYLAKLVRLLRQVIPPKIALVASRRRRHSLSSPVRRRTLIKCLEQNTHLWL